MIGFDEVYHRCKAISSTFSAVFFWSCSSRLEAFNSILRLRMDVLQSFETCIVLRIDYDESKLMEKMWLRLEKSSYLPFVRISTHTNSLFFWCVITACVLLMNVILSLSLFIALSLSFALTRRFVSSIRLSSRLLINKNTLVLYILYLW